MIRRISILLISVIILVSFSIPVFAENVMNHQPQAQILNDLGLFKGGNNGFELDRQPTRIEAAVMLVRLLGKESEALNGSWSHSFDDVPTWADKYIGYLYSKGLAKGNSTTVFGSADLCNASMYTTFVLRSLGYSDAAGEFTYKDSLNFAVEIKLISESNYSSLSKSFLRDDMVAISYNSLNTNVKNEDRLLIDKLINEGAVTEEDAIKVGIKKVSVSKPDVSKPDVQILNSGYYVTNFRNSAMMYLDKSKLQNLENAFYLRLASTPNKTTNDELQKTLTEEVESIDISTFKKRNVVEINSILTFCNATLLYEGHTPYVALYDSNANLLACRLIKPEDYVYGDSHFIRFEGECYVNGPARNLFTVKRYINGVVDETFNMDQVGCLVLQNYFSTTPLFVKNDSVEYEFIINDPLLKKVVQIVHVPVPNPY